MEGEDPHRRQYEHANYPSGFAPNMRTQSIAGISGSEIYETPNIRGVQRAGASGRFRQAHMPDEQVPTSAAMSVTGAHAQGLGVYGFGQGQGQQYTATNMQGNSLPYQSQYVQDPQRQQQFSGYTSQMMPGVPQQVQSYEQLPHYPSRQSAAPGMLSSQFVEPHYYNPSDSTSASVPASMPQHYGPVNYQSQMQYQSTSMNRPEISPAYTSGMAEFSQAEPTEQDAQPGPTWEREFDSRLREINENISSGMLREAAPTLLDLSKWLLGRVNEFGTYTLDVLYASLRESRITYRCSRRRHGRP